MPIDAILIALPDEAPNLQMYKNVFFTGVGKVNAAITATKILHTHSIGRIFNFGTAGGITVSAGYYECKNFIQHDMDCSPLGFKLGETPFESESLYSFGEGLFGEGLTCASGDSFVTNGIGLRADIVDMEAYSIAKVCKTYNRLFFCFKYISDSADSNASTDWQSNVSNGEKFFLETIKSFNIKLIG